MGRIYSVTTGFASASAGQAYDWLDIEAGAANRFILHQLTLSQSSDYGDTQAEGIQVQLKRAAAGYTNSGPGTSNCTITAYQSSGQGANTLAVATFANTTAATGTIAPLYQEAWNVQAPWIFIPTPELRPIFLAGEGLILSIGAPTGDALDAVAAVALIEEF